MDKNRNEVSRALLALGAIAGFIAVALGAFGTHALRSRLSAGMMGTFNTGVQYQAVHALALLLVAVLAERRPANPLLLWVGGLFAFGILFFSGSLYLLAISGKHFLGAITPLGGLCFLTGWALLTVAAVKE